MNNIEQLHDKWLVDYELTHPKPITGSTRTEKIQWFIILTAVVFYSSNHNISFLQGNEDGLGSIAKNIAIVVMVEGILIKAGERFAKYLPTDQLQKARLIMVMTLGIMSLIVAISGNVFDLLQSKGFYVSSELETWVLIIVGFTAPLMAVFAGVMFTSIDSEQTEQMEKWMIDMRREWTRFKRKNDVSISVSNGQKQLSVSADRRTDADRAINALAPVNTSVDKRTLIREYMTEHPESINLSVRDLAKVISEKTGHSVGKTVVSEVKGDFVD